jgi:DNA primase catalytic subunit
MAAASASKTQEAWQEEDVLAYWRMLYPAEEIVALFGSTPNREFSFTYGDAYLRFQRCVTGDDLRKLLAKKCDSKIGATTAHAGAIYPRAVDRQDRGEPIACELRYDIDLNSYDDLRAMLCGCKDDKACDDCFLFAQIGARLLVLCLKDRLGCKNFLPVYSGRRGMHLLVLDAGMRGVSKEAREAISKNVGAQEHPKMCQKRGVLWWAQTDADHLMVDQSGIRAELVKLFEKLFVAKYRVLEKHLDEVIRGFPDTVKREVQSKEHKTSEARWRALRTAVLRESLGSSNCKAGYVLQRSMDRLLASCFLPRLDAGPSALGHLLKLPFSVHAKTGRVAVPIEESRLMEFVPSKCPTVVHVSAYLNKITKTNPLQEPLAVLRRAAKQSETKTLLGKADF